MTYNQYPSDNWQPPAKTPNRGRGCLYAIIGITVLGLIVVALLVAAVSTTDVTSGVATTTGPTVTEPSAPDETPSQSNAREKAKDYLDFSAFSRTGLIDQLKFEQFSEADATYGVDVLNVDWNAQAEKKAAQYLETQSFSRSGLVDQLVFEGFTPEQAEHGVSTTGL